MKLSKKSVYALRSLRLLTKAYGKNTLSVSHLSKVEGLPAKYLEQVLLTLKKSGFLISERGKEGGYALRLPPEEITLGDVIRSIDGPLAPLSCASRTAPHECTDCPYPFETCWMRKIMLRVRDNISAILDKETLATMTASAGDVVAMLKDSQ